MEAREQWLKGFMIVSGAISCAMIYAAILPKAALNTAFGESLEGPLAELIVRNWGFLITMVGVLLIYGAIRPGARTIALVIAGLTKSFYISLVLAQGDRFLSKALPSLVIDSVMVLVIAGILVGQMFRPSRP